MSRCPQLPRARSSRCGSQNPSGFFFVMRKMSIFVGNTMKVLKSCISPTKCATNSIPSKLHLQSARLTPHLVAKPVTEIAFTDVRFRADKQMKIYLDWTPFIIFWYPHKTKTSSIAPTRVTDSLRRVAESAQANVLEILTIK